MGFAELNTLRSVEELVDEHPASGGRACVKYCRLGISPRVLGSGSNWLERTSRRQRIEVWVVVE